MEVVLTRADRRTDMMKVRAFCDYESESDILNLKFITVLFSVTILINFVYLQNNITNIKRLYF